MLTSYWPVPLATHLCPDAANINPTLARVFRALRATEALNNPDSQAVVQEFYASNDQLLKRVDLQEFKQLIQFFAHSLQQTVSAVNKDTWPKEKISLQLEILGCWFQIQNGMAFHDVHTHGNCSWSGVYYVQIDRTEKRISHPAMGEQNGVTRFYGPYSQWQAGAHMDIGNAYLQKNTLDVEPEEGKLVLFPAYLPHKAMPYEGDLDRIIVSFNAQLHAVQGDQLFDFSAR